MQWRIDGFGRVSRETFRMPQPSVCVPKCNNLVKDAQRFRFLRRCTDVGVVKKGCRSTKGQEASLAF